MALLSPIELQSLIASIALHTGIPQESVILPEIPNYDELVDMMVLEEWANDPESISCVPEAIFNPEPSVSGFAHNYGFVSDINDNGVVPYYGLLPDINDDAVVPECGPTNTPESTSYDHGVTTAPESTFHPEPTQNSFEPFPKWKFEADGINWYAKSILPSFDIKTDRAQVAEILADPSKFSSGDLLNVNQVKIMFTSRNYIKIKILLV